MATTVMVTTTTVADPRADLVPYRDPATGFTVLQPRTWTVRSEGPLTEFRDPATGGSVQITVKVPPGPPPQETAAAREQAFAAENPTYQRLQRGRYPYLELNSILWEFTHTAGDVTLHTIDISFVTDAYGFSQTYQARADDWARLFPVFREIIRSFQLPPAPPG